MADAANAMRQITRNMRNQRRRMRRRHKVKGRAGEYEVERADFDCVYLCGACGYYADPPDVAPPEGDASSEAPSEDSSDREPQSPCPACAETEWMDLAIQPLADRVRDMEAEERMKPPTFVTQLVVGVPLAVCALVMAWFIFSDASYHYVMIAPITALLVVPLAYRFLRRPLAVMLLRDKERTPDRWHVPLDLPEPDQTESRRLEDLEVQPTSDTLTAPASGRRCVAYQLSVLFDTPGDARPPEWVLQEQRTVGARLGDALELAPGELYLESDEELIDVDERYEEVKQFLRQRGLFITDGDFEFHEAVLEPSDRVDAADYDGQIYVVEAGARRGT